jgi:hypothetical protein
MTHRGVGKKVDLMSQAVDFITAEDLSAFHDDELPANRREEVVLHAAVCKRCTEALALWKRADRELLRVAAERRQRVLLAAPVAALVAFLLTAGVAVAAGLGPFRVLQVATTPAPDSRGGPALVARGESLVEMRNATGLPLPTSTVLAGTWQLQGVVKVQGGVVLTYGRLDQRLSVNVLPLAQHPSVVADPSFSEQLEVEGQPSLLVRRVPSQSYEAIFEHGSSAVVITVDGRLVQRDQLIALVKDWLATAR